MTSYHWTRREIVKRGLSAEHAEEILSSIGAHRNEDWQMVIDPESDAELMLGVFFEIVPVCLAWIEQRFPTNKDLRDRFLTQHHEP